MERFVVIITNTDDATFSVDVPTPLMCESKEQFYELFLEAFEKRENSRSTYYRLQKEVQEANISKNHRRIAKANKEFDSHVENIGGLDEAAKLIVCNVDFSYFSDVRFNDKTNRCEIEDFPVIMTVDEWFS